MKQRLGYTKRQVGIIKIRQRIWEQKREMMRTTEREEERGRAKGSKW